MNTQYLSEVISRADSGASLFIGSILLLIAIVGKLAGPRKNKGDK